MKFLLKQCSILCIFLSQLSIFTAQAPGGCTSLSVRKEIRSLTDDELSRFIRAMLRMNQRQGDGMSRYDEFVNIHLTNVPIAHGTPAFFPWHRQYIRDFELELQKIDPSVSLPFWDWSLDSQAPERSVIFTERYFGTSKNNDCIPNGPFQNWRVTLPDPHCVKRNFDGGATIGAFYSPEMLVNMFRNASHYHAFRLNIEGAPHGRIHAGIGGDMAVMMSPNDPIFFVHHAFIDKIWHDWQVSNPQYASSYGGDGNESIRDQIPPWNIPVSRLLDISALCYSYSGSAPLGQGRFANTPRFDPARARNPRAVAAPGRAPPARPPARPNAPAVPNRRVPPPAGRITRRDELNQYSDYPDQQYQGDANASYNAPAENYSQGYGYDLDGYDRSNMEYLRAPPPVPDSWIEMHKLSPAMVRAQENDCKDYVYQLNEDPNYHSPVALGTIGETLQDILGGVGQTLNNVVGGVGNIVGGLLGGGNNHGGLLGGVLGGGSGGNGLLGGVLGGGGNSGRGGLLGGLL
ncbi:Di-copper centre-containing protein [Conidiobolus coronatus NRRL 28638]|uniref:Di-copper centre-containing protein n=1 Tax=Conidiobolus coronatus (strain ATCC 28846 / CBS 209.66 / NRRL 28638) TaxID=796925 RepID=A0A137PFI2_CONC2|nr:Di-copper centre-containing protein [Conidiobolus coronatus NRRL 28638]|eukprot:KXN73691.1 Di-copper centre-containing protein [Conidiobolus coronatus NRRL 28638]